MLRHGRSRLAEDREGTVQVSLLTLSFEYELTYPCSHSLPIQKHLNKTLTCALRPFNVIRRFVTATPPAPV